MVGPAKSPVAHPPEVLQELYEVPNPADLAEIVAKGSAVIDLLVEARAQIERFFGRRGSPRLFLERDPEFGTETIMVGIPIAEVVDDMKRLNQFDDQWWVAIWSHETANICITMDTR